MDPSGRMTCDELLDHSYFDHFRDWFQPELEMLLVKDARKVAKSKSRMHVSLKWNQESVGALTSRVMGSGIC